MPRQSAGILLFRRAGGIVQFLLVHPGGPFWSKKDEGAWSIPKGLYEAPENAIDAARRELREEIGAHDHGRSRRTRKIQAAGGQGRFGLGGRERLRCRRSAKQCVLAGVAAEVGQAKRVSRSRSRRLVLDHRGRGENHERPASHPHETRFGARPRFFWWYGNLTRNC